MMQIILPRSWREEFALAASLKREEILQRERMAQFASHQRQITIEKKIEEKRREQEFATLMEAAFVPPQRIAEYHVKLDRYDTKTVEALMDNQQARDFVREKINVLLGNAHTLPDGRRVFKTIDGQQVFDEHGQAVDRDTIDPSIIDDRKPKWEAYRDSRLEERRLSQEREQLLDYQAKLDSARDRLDKGYMTEGELKKMETDLSGTMPDAVREKLGLAKPKAEAAPDIQPNAPPKQTIAESVMGNTGLGPAGPSPG